MKRLPSLSAAAFAQAFCRVQPQLAGLFQRLDTPMVDSHLMLSAMKI
jgi:hypothetical protein